MMRVAIVLCLVALAALTFGVYQGVTMSRAQEAELRAIDAAIAEEQGRIKILKADWALLTKPDRLQDLAQRHLALAPVAAAQFALPASLPMRSAPRAGLTLDDVPKRTLTQNPEQKDVTP